MEFQPVLVEIVFHSGVVGCPWNLNAKLTELPTQIKNYFSYEFDRPPKTQARAGSWHSMIVGALVTWAIYAQGQLLL